MIGIAPGDSVFRCSRHTESAWHSYLGGRVDEGSAYDCPASSPGGQCVALLKCKCGLPWTGAWQADVKVELPLRVYLEYHLDQFGHMYRVG